jgi:hypothetical protein
MPEEMPAEDILNIEYHTKRLLLKALNKYRYNYEAARELGICERQLYRYKRQYNVIYDNNEWVMVEKVIEQKRPLHNVA